MFSTKDLNSNNIKSEKLRAKTILSGYAKVGCDAINVGNYELLAGLNFLKSIKAEYSSPFISANIRDSKSNQLVFKPYTILERDDLKIGIIGLNNSYPDTIKSVVVDDYISSGNNIISKISKEVNIIVLLINSGRSTYESLPELFPKADFIFVSGSTMRTNSNTPQRKNGPFVYSPGKQGKYLTVADVSIKENGKKLFDISSVNKKIKSINKRFSRLQKKDPNRTLDEIYKDQNNILKLIAQYRSDLDIAEEDLSNAINTFTYNMVSLNKKIKDDPDMKVFVENAVKQCDLLNTNKIKKPKHNHK